MLVDKLEQEKIRVCAARREYNVLNMDAPAPPHPPRPTCNAHSRAFNSATPDLCTISSVRIWIKSAE